jgi:EpsG family
MVIYWLLFAFPALMAVAYPVSAGTAQRGTGQGLAMGAFVLFYTLVGGLRHETGGDWETYILIFEYIEYEGLEYALTKTDPLFGLLNLFSSLIGTSVYLPNAVCCMILGIGVIRAARTTREPWLAIVMAVPYLLIVVGMGYVRQGAAIGMMLIALATIDSGRPFRALGWLLVGVGFHVSAVIVFPVFVFALAKRYKFFAISLSGLAAVVFILLLAPRLGTFSIGYLEAEYESSGAGTRLAMGLLPALLLLARLRSFPASGHARAVWIAIAFANLVALAGLILSPSSTAVDRLALYFSTIQLVVFGNLRALLGLGERTGPLVRLLAIGVAGSIQVVWLVFATHAYLWVPYTSVLGAS